MRLYDSQCGFISSNVIFFVKLYTVGSTNIGNVNVFVIATLYLATMTLFLAIANLYRSPFWLYIQNVTLVYYSKCDWSHNVTLYISQFNNINCKLLTPCSLKHFLLHVLVSPHTSNSPELQSPPVCVIVVTVVVVSPRPGWVSTGSSIVALPVGFASTSFPPGESIWIREICFRSKTLTHNPLKGLT